MSFGECNNAPAQRTQTVARRQFQAELGGVVLGVQPRPIHNRVCRNAGVIQLLLIEPVEDDRALFARPALLSRRVLKLIKAQGSGTLVAA